MKRTLRIVLYLTMIIGILAGGLILFGRKSLDVWEHMPVGIYPGDRQQIGISYYLPFSKDPWFRMDRYRAYQHEDEEYHCWEGVEVGFCDSGCGYVVWLWKNADGADEYSCFQNLAQSKQFTFTYKNREYKNIFFYFTLP